MGNGDAWRLQALACEDKNTQNDQAKEIHNFHSTLRIFLRDLHDNCKHIGSCKRFPALICMRSLHKHPDIDCGLYQEGFFPLLLDAGFVKAVKNRHKFRKKPVTVTKDTGKRFEKMVQQIEKVFSKKQS